MTKLSAAGALALGFASFAPFSFASDPASHDVTVPAQGKSVVVEWTGTALPGASAAAGTGNFEATDLAGAPTVIGCAPVGPDDAHDINITVPDGFYDSNTVTADFHVEWDGETHYADTVGDPDLALTVYEGTVNAMGYSDGGNPSENVGVTNPASGTYTAIVCPFTASQPTPYRARLTLTTTAPKACKAGSGATVTNAAPGSGSAGGFGADAPGLPNYDVFQAEAAVHLKAVPTDAAGRLQSVIYDRTLGLPTFLWARADAPVAAVGALSDPRELLIAHARAHLRNEAKELRLSSALINEATVTDAGFNGDGPAVVRFSQRVNGIEVFHRSLNVLLDRSYKPVAVSGYFANGFNRAALAAFARTPAQAVATAWTSLGGSLDAGALQASQVKGDWQWFERPNVSGTYVFQRGPRAKAVYYPRAGALEPAYQVELFANAKFNGSLLAYSLIVSAIDGRVLHRENLKADAFGYRVYADAKGPLHQPYDSPLGNDYDPFPAANRSQHLERKKDTAANLVTLDHAGIVTNDPWLTDDATTTSGNNVDACKDTYDQSVSTPAGGLAVPPPVNSCVKQIEPNTKTTGDHVFDYDSPADEDPSTARAVGQAIVNLFYMNNWLHDWWYNHGFDEAAGNAQASNYGRTDPALEGDQILAQGQDGSGRNNANMATPSDGSSPVMQQYLFDGYLAGEVRVTAPYDSGPLTWAAIHDTGDNEYDLTGAVALAHDGTGDSDSDGCGPTIPYPDAVVEASPVGAPVKAPVAPPDSNLQGKIALVDRGTCNTTYKIQFALASGAVGLVVVNNVDGDPPTNIGNLDIPLAPVEPTHYAYAQMPTVIIRKDDGDRIKAALAAGSEVSLHLLRTPSVDVDGTRDNQIIAHEFFHYVHHRLTASSNTQSRAMSEGWGDIDAFMMTVRPEDTVVQGNGNFGGAYGLAGYVTNSFFAGIRRAPYSTNFDDNGFTLRHIAEGAPTPDGGTGVGNSEVHSAGEIWANEMFECYIGIQNNPKHGFADARSAMQDYIIAGFKMTPADATYTEARDAILAAALAADPGDYQRCSHGFARRGNGLNAVAPARSSSDLTGVVEDFGEFVCHASPREATAGEGRGLLVGAFGPGLLLPLFGLSVLRRRRRS